MHPKQLSIQNFTYKLPNEKIAFRPLPERSQSKLLIYANSTIATNTYQNISDYIPENALMVFNDSKVVEARLLFQKPSGGTIEIFCLEPHEQYADITSAMSQTGSVKWLCLIGGASKWKKGQILEHTQTIGQKELRLRAAYLEKRADSFVIELTWEDENISFADILHSVGIMPLPPYIKRDAEPADHTRYQTVYARFDGSVAAPTAGLHFTESMLKSIRSKNIQEDFVTLHVGAGTFKPVKAEKMANHDMHAEYFEASKAVIGNLLSRLFYPVVAVGTTSLRTLESLYWLGIKLLQNPQVFDKTIPHLSQWEIYDSPRPTYSVEDALKALLQYLEIKKLDTFVAKTQILIAPGYEFKIVTGLVTNFHQPMSTLLLLVAAFVGEEWQCVYDFALENNFRFLSYGDGCLLWAAMGKRPSTV